MANKVERPKELWDHFKPTELKIIGAYMYAYQARLPQLKDVDIKGADGRYTGQRELDQVQPLPKYFTNSITRTVAPWTIYDRFRMAYQTFDSVMKKMPGSSLKYAIAEVQPDGSVTSGNIYLEDKLIAESKRVWNVIFGPGGLTWGDEKQLAQWADEYEEVMTQYGFKRTEIPPFDRPVGEMSNIRSLDDMEPESMIPAKKKKENAPPVTPFPEAATSTDGSPTSGETAPAPKKRGRPKTVVA